MITTFHRSAARFIPHLAVVVSLMGCSNSGNGTAAGGVGSEAIRANGEGSPVPSSPAAESAPLSTEEIQKAVSQLGRLRTEDEARLSVERLARQGDAAVVEIERRVAGLGYDFGWVHRSVSVLEKVNSETSRQLLKQIALGEVAVENTTLRGWAARRLVACDSSEARALLSSRDASVLEAAILGLRGQALDPELLTALTTHTRNDDPITRWQAASILAQEAPPGELSLQALSAIKDALRAVATIPDIDGTTLLVGLGSWQMTSAETHYQRYLSILCETKAENPALREIAGDLKGPARDVVLLALALRKDKTVHQDVVRILEDPDAGLFRMWAASGLEQIGATADLPALRRVATADPLQRSDGSCVRPNRRAFPVRESAQQAITTIERRLSEIRPAP